ncbi:MAG: hypothetical protein LKF34_03440 [Acidaminococcaceae bacterium]|nr:hypothetical protein [Acidaminococcaceae bacterium]
MLRMYINGTPGGTDGTAITSLTFKNFMKYAKGNATGNGITSFAYLPVFLREETGLKANNVQISVGVSWGTLATGCSAGYTSWPANNTGVSLKCYFSPANIGAVGQTNVMILLAVGTGSTSIASGQQLFTISYAEDVA